MGEMTLPHAWLSDDGRTVHVRRGGWQGSFPANALGRWLSFYRSLRDGKAGKYAAHYGPMVDALVRVQRDLERRNETLDPEGPEES